MTNNILFLGEYSSGKTALINMILGYPILPEKLIATDMPVVKISSGNTNNIYYKTADSIEHIISWKQLPAEWSKFSHANIEVSNHPLLDNGLVIWDTPGINSTNPMHQNHLSDFLNKYSDEFRLIYYLIPDKLTQTSIDFIQKWKPKLNNLVIVINIKDIKTYEESRQIEREVKKTVMSTLGTIPVHLLKIGDICEEFNEMYKNNNDWFEQNEWQTKLDKFKSLIETNIDSIIGEDIFDIINSFYPNNVFKEKLKQKNEIEQVNKESMTAPQQKSSLFDLILERFSPNGFSEDFVFNQGLDFYSSKEYKKAFDCFFKAASKGHVKSFHWLGKLYGYGEGVEYNEEKSYLFYFLAAKKGYSEAIEAVKLFKTKDNHNYDYDDLFNKLFN